MPHFLTRSDREAAVRANMQDIDDAFMYLLSQRVAEANESEEAALNEVHSIILREAGNQFPPEVMLLNRLMESDGEAELEEILDEKAARDRVESAVLIIPVVIPQQQPIQDQVIDFADPFMCDQTAFGPVYGSTPGGCEPFYGGGVGGGGPIALGALAVGIVALAEDDNPPADASPAGL